MRFPTDSRRPLRTLAIVAALACTMLLATVDAADAEMLTYREADGNVWAENVDGSERHAVTTDAGGLEGFSYFRPSANDAGDIAALKTQFTRSSQVLIAFIPANGGPVVTNFMPLYDGRTPTPFSARLRPDGKLLAYSYGLGPSLSRYGNVVPADAPGAPIAAQGFAGMFQPTWHGSDLVYTNVTSVYYGAASTNPWLQTTGANIPFAEVSRDAKHLLALISPSTGAKRLLWSDLTGPMPSTPGDGCYVPYSGTLHDHALSPDGTRVSWTDDAGLHVGRPAIQPGAEESCRIDGERLVSATGRDASFSAATLTPPPAGGGNPGGDPPGGGGNPDGPDQGGSGNPDNPKPRVAVARQSLRTVLRSGLRVTLSGLPSGKVTVRALRGRGAVATKKVKVTSGRSVKVTLKLSSRARSQLRRAKSVKLMLVAGAARTNVTLR